MTDERVRAREMLLAQVSEAPGPVATHDLLDAVQPHVPGMTEVDLLETLLGLVEERRLETMSDHGTVYFVASTDRP